MERSNNTYDSIPDNEKQPLIPKLGKKSRRSCGWKLVLSGLGVLSVVTLLCVTLFRSHIHHDKSHVNVLTSASVNTYGQKSKFLSPTGVYANAAAATDHHECSKIASDVMQRQNGSVVDAAIAALLCDGVHNAHSMGIGGGSMMVVYASERNGSSKTAAAIDSRETAPRRATSDMYSKGASSTDGGLAVAVPGEIAGMHAAWTRFGRLPWKKLFEPTIRLCRQGYHISSKLAGKLSTDMHESLREVYSREDGTLAQPGDLLYRPKLADTLELIAEKGPRVFYAGQLTQTIANEVQQFGGILEANDLRHYQVKTRRPVITSLLGKLRILSLPPPASGPLLQFMLRVLEEKGLNSSWLDSLKGNINTHHVFAEMLKFASALRPLLGDEEFVNVDNIVQNLTSPEFARYIASRIDMKRTHGLEYYGFRFRDPDKISTAQLSFLAPDGSAVSVTSTINTSFGSKRRGPLTGIIYNNEMDDFSFDGGPSYHSSLPPSEANSIVPGKRPLSNMCPSIVLDDKDDVVMAIGAAGGSKITPTAALVMTYNLLLNRSLSEAIDEPRLFFKFDKNVIQCELETESEVVEGLRRKGHQISKIKPSSVSQGIVTINRGDEKVVMATSDYRKSSGAPNGY